VFEYFQQQPKRIYPRCPLFLGMFWRHGTPLVTYGRHAPLFSLPLPHHQGSFFCDSKRKPLAQGTNIKRDEELINDSAKIFSEVNWDGQSQH